MIQGITIRGIGIDLVSLSEFDRLCRDTTSRFLDHHFTPAEIQYAERAAGRPVEHLAVRYAAKEALIKALDQTQLFRPARIGPVDYREIEVTRDPQGRPYFIFSGKLREMIADLKVVTLVSLSHDGDYAVAQVVVTS